MEKSHFLTEKIRKLEMGMETSVKNFFMETSVKNFFMC
jgi:hypothetical protein